ncbi:MULTISPECIES: hypothetical protein [unclassified Rickettsia]|uniref:hypothetical protein n=1 Tax=unclassified Rickettsia TaxID=114295 RepID=UPI003132C286
MLNNLVILISTKNYLFNQLMKIIDVKYLIGNKNTMKFFLLSINKEKDKGSS